ncbi:Ribosomal protein S18 acetylase RimI [Mucilaginibacter pineti]|uniref:Ribosomal protein S18 acetylase RimI n=1 Tax=Mucilaginibacter pineti TaxID=1391627 RepID=A0A1G7I5S3_9SPHI|nr:GNAT family N-acetyltransferase [Mucilaginibacter pineti]SDF07886.1 Ribosomal protein S18 acetylase RimI [Mucilaginibacter pineti]
MLIRQATLNDIPTLLQFEQGVISAERPFDSTLIDSAIKYYDLEEFITSPDIEFLVAEVDDILAGCGYARIMESPKPYFKYATYAYLGFMYVLPQYRGRGVNQLIVEALKQWSRKQGLTEIRLQVYNDNEPAIKAYEKAGFVKHMVEMRVDID